MKTKILIFISILILGCSKDDNIKPNINPCSIDNNMKELNVNTDFYLSLKNSSNEDLLNSATKGHFLSENIILYEVINGVKQDVYDSNMDNPKGFTVSENKGIYILTAGVPFHTSDKPVSEQNGIKIFEHTLYLKFSETVTDTIKTSSKEGCGYLNLTKVWYNNKLVMDRDNNLNPRVIEIIK